MDFQEQIDWFKSFMTLDEPIILWEDKDLLAIVKPWGWVVNRATSVKGVTVQDWLGVRYGELYRLEENTDQNEREARENEDWDRLNSMLFYKRNGIVHRLDKDTSGVMVVAKSVPAYLDLLRQFRERQVQKKYLAMVHGIVDPPKGVISAAVGRLPWNRKRFGIVSDGRKAMTSYEVVQMWRDEVVDYYDKQGFSLVAFMPKTGRTHQIRVHAQYLGYPIVGDMYAGRKTMRRDLKWCGRLLLHAKELSLTHPINGKGMQLGDQA